MAFKNIQFIYKDGELEIQKYPHYPDAERFVRVSGPIAEQLKAMTLHASDLDFALSMLNLLNNTTLPKELRIGLWECAITSFFKCFTSSKSRSKLSEDKVFKAQKDALPAFAYFKNLRDKHIVHDENSYTQAFVGAIINKQGAGQKVADIVATALGSVTLDQQHFQTFHSLVSFTKVWVNGKRDELHIILWKEYESKSYEDLCQLETVKFKVPTSQEVNINRTK